MLDTSVIRLLDILGAMIGLLSSALFLIISVLIKLDSKGPVFYTQLMIGRNRRKRDNGYICSEAFELIQRDSGNGKDLTARTMIHYQTLCSNMLFSQIECGVIQENLLANGLF